ncbi:flagellin FliC [bacterium]|nr:flagellin FliC [bacterium]
MGLRIKTNVQSIIAQHKLDDNISKLDATQNRLASGQAIVTAKDDAAGLAISENLRNTMRSTGQNIKNTQNAGFMLQTADNAIGEITNIVIRMKELAVQAASDTNGDKERGYLNHEYQALKSELDRISDSALFNGRPLLNGAGESIAIQVGPNNNSNIDRIEVAADFNINTNSLGLSELGITSSEGAREALEPIASALERIAGVRGSIGASESRLETTLRNLMVYEENIAGAYSKIRDADIAAETAEYAKTNILNQANVAVLAQANQMPALALKLLN